MISVNIRQFYNLFPVLIFLLSDESKKHFIVHQNSVKGSFIFSKNTFEMRYIEMANRKFFSTDTGEILAKIKDTHMLKLCAEKIHSRPSFNQKGNFNEM